MNPQFIKAQIDATDEHMLAWLKGDGLVIGHWGTGLPATSGQPAPVSVDPEEWHTDPKTVSEREHYRLMSNSYPLDTLPIAIPDINTLPLAVYLGATPEYSTNNVWYRHVDLAPDNDSPLHLDENHPALINHMEMLAACRRNAEGRYLVGLPALVPNLDVLAELRGAQDLMMDMVMDPGWVHRKLREINDVFYRVYERMIPLATDDKGWSTQGYFMFRGPGRVGLAHCDTAALISPAMFREFVVPCLREQTEFLDWSLYHVDGPDALRTVEALLELEDLTALQFTPGPQVPGGGDEKWFDLYRRIKSAGKSVMAVWVKPEEIKPLLDSVGPHGMYVMVDMKSERDVELVRRDVEGFDCIG